MENSIQTSFFLGANSGSGFYSLYSGLTDTTDCDFLWILKGGPGSGKSVFLRKIGAAAEKLGYDVEYILCSGDPDSLDAVYLPEKRIAYADGTSPHTLDAAFPPATGKYLDLGAFCNSAALRGSVRDIAALTERYREYYSRAYGFLGAAEAVDPLLQPGLLTEDEIKAAVRRMGGIAFREFGRPVTKRGHRRKRFIEAITCKGRIFLTDTVSALCPRIYLMDNNYGLARYCLEVLCEEATERGHDCIVCPDPLTPRYTGALIIPSLGLGFFSSGCGIANESEVYRHIRLDSIVDAARLRLLRGEFRAAVKLQGELLDSGIKTLASAKSLHDSLEETYHPHMDFSGLDELAEEHIRRL